MILPRGFLLLAVSALLAISASASTDSVVHLTASDFTEKTGDPEKVYFIKFFAPWCGHCKKLAPTWAELAKEVNGDSAVVASVDCTQHKSVCQDADIKGYPTLKVYQGGEAREQYKGARTLEALKEFVDSQKKLLLQETTA